MRFATSIPKKYHDTTMTTSPKCCSSTRDIGLLVLRVGVAILFIMHGYGKLFGHAPGMEMFTGMVTGMGFPLPTAFAYLAALSEFVGGIALLLGVFTCTAGTLTAITMFVAFAFAHKFDLNAGGAAFSLLVSSIALALLGPGKYSVKAMMGKEKEGCCGMGGNCCTPTENTKK